MNSASSRAPAVAGLFYPRDHETLRQTLAELLGSTAANGSVAPKALIAPHAGYVYSGPIAANAYARLSAARDTIRKVVLLGPTHRVAVRGIAVPAVDQFVTPLGAVQIDADAVRRLRALPQVCVSDEAHALEHSLEVHVPFLQTVLTDFTLVPLAVGHVEPDQVAEAIEAVYGGPETLIVVSSDLSHYLPYGQAQSVDRSTCDAILALSSEIDHEHACGATPVGGLSLVARRKGLKPQLIDLRNSGDTAGDRSRVVGYASFAFYEPA
jgi:AmmeMemoRadiSam system protein B